MVSKSNFLPVMDCCNLIYLFGKGQNKVEMVNANLPIKMQLVKTEQPFITEADEFN